MRHLCLDLELEQPFTNPQTPDSRAPAVTIIQVGWVVYETLPFKLLETGVSHTNYPCALSEFIRKLTGITPTDMRTGVDLKKIYRRMEQDRQLYDASRIITEWGGGDVKELQEAVGDRGGFASSGFNVKHLFRTYCELNNISTRGGLSKSMGKVGLQWEPVPGYHKSNKHDALVDAYNTARMHAHILNLLNNKVIDR